MFSFSTFGPVRFELSMYFVAICVDDVVPLRGFVVDKELNGGHGLDLMTVLMMMMTITMVIMMTKAMDRTSLSSESSFLLLGPGTEVTREGVAGSYKLDVRALDFLLSLP